MSLFPQVQSLSSSSKRSLYHSWRSVDLIQTIWSILDQCSTMQFFSKVLVKVVLRQIQKQLSDNSLLKMRQSAFRKDHSTDCCAGCSWLPISEGRWEACLSDCSTGPQRSILHARAFHSSGKIKGDFRRSGILLLSGLHPMSMIAVSLLFLMVLCVLFV